MIKTALYPGTFDPITNGHYDIIARALKLFDRVIVAVAESHSKKPMFTLDERVSMANAAVGGLQNVEVIGFDNLTIDLAKEYGADILIRGLRAVSDFEYELQLGYLNHSLDANVETVYLMPSLRNAFVSSSIVRNLLTFNGKTEHLLPAEVEAIIRGMDSCTLS
ncbi:pantetheine-phosphate adenylyltransferase [Thiomicrolovo sp. ZZH C-3]